MSKNIFSEKLFVFIGITSVVTVELILNFSLVVLILSAIWGVIVLARNSLNEQKMIGCFFVLITVTTIFHQRQNVTEYTGEETEIYVVFNEVPNMDGDQLTGFMVDANTGEEVWVSYKIESEEEKEMLEASTFCDKVFKVTGTLEQPSGATVENGFDFKMFLYYEEAHWAFNVESSECVGERSGVHSRILTRREEGMILVKENLPEPLQSHTLALIFGYQDNISEEQYDAYKELGVVHLFSISGMHVGLLVAAVYMLFIRIGITRNTAMILIICILPVYAILTGFSPSVIRASSMVIILFAGKLLKFRVTPLIAINLTILIFMFINPYEVFSIGFQLSFVICYGLILSRTILEKVNGYFRQLFVGTFFCQLFSLPIIIYNFYEVSLIGMFANLIYIPLFTFVYFPLTIFSYIVLLIRGSSLGIITEFINFLFEMLVNFSMLLAELPFVMLTFGKPTTMMLLLISGATILLFVSFEFGRRRLIIVSSIFLACTLFVQYHYNFFSSKGEVTMLDVGQGDSIFIQLPHNQGNYLIDTGGAMQFEKEAWATKESPYDPGKDMIVPFLKSKGVKEIDKLILTHADADHAGGAGAVIELVGVEEVVIPKGHKEDFAKYEWYAASEELFKEVESGDTWYAADDFFQVVYPIDYGEDTNENSIVLYAVINGVTWLFMGDSGFPSEEEILKTYPEIEVDVLKVGHHGSANSTSQELLDATNPSVAWISVGESNRYGHPEEDVLEKLENEDIRVYRTDEDGSVKYSYSRFNKGEVETFS